jgi:hypothetical protein
MFSMNNRHSFAGNWPMFRLGALIIAATLSAAPAIGPTPETAARLIALAKSDPFLPLRLDSPDLLVRALLTGTVTAAMFESNFARVDEMAKFYRDSEARTPGGAWKLSVLYDSLSDLHDPQRPYDEYPYKKAEAKSLRWIAASPKSPTPYIAYSEQLIAHAWFCWECGSPNADVATNNRNARAYVEKARSILESNKTMAAADPEWYVAMLSVASAEHWDRKRFEPILQEGLERFPYYTHIYFAGSVLYRPDHGGSIDDFDTFVEDAVGRTASKEGTSLYARIYARNAPAFGNMFKTTRVSWPKMFNSFMDIEGRYPDVRNDNLFAYYACAVGDRISTAMMMPKIALAQPDYEVWGNQDNLNRCKAWAGGPRRVASESPMPAWQSHPPVVWQKPSLTDLVALYDLVLLVLIERNLFG